jgi:hypothetical protein
MLTGRTFEGFITGVSVVVMVMVDQVGVGVI